MDAFTIKILTLGPLEANCYVVGAEDEAIIIDPASAAALPAIEEAVAGRTVTAIILTHGHFDHIDGVDCARDRFTAPVFIHEQDAVMLSDANRNLSAFFSASRTYREADRFISEGDTFAVGEKKFTAIHTPGHTPGSVSLYGEGALFSGDVLFAYGVGRTDFPGGKEIDLLFSIKEKLFKLPDETLLYPGHESTGMTLAKRKTFGI